MKPAERRDDALHDMIRTLEPHLLAPLIEARVNKEFAVRETYQGRDQVATISPVTEAEALTLASRGVVTGDINKHGFLRNLRLLVSVQAARRILKRNRRHMGERIPVAEDNYTVRRVIKPECAYFEFRQKVCAAYAR